MYKKSFNAVLGTAVLALSGYSTVASAHTQAGSLLAPAAATDLYAVNCSNDGSGDTTNLFTQIVRGTGTAELAVTSLRNDSSATNSHTTGGALSPGVTLNGPNGNFIVAVTKSAAGLTTYTLTYHCQSGAVHTGTSIGTLQNQ